MNNEVNALNSQLAAANAEIKELKEASDDYIRSVFHNSPDPQLVVGNNRFIDCNVASIKFLNAQSKNHILSSDYAQLSPKYQMDGQLSIEKGRAMMEIAIRDGFNQFEWMHRKFTGEHFLVETTIRSICTNGTDLLYIHWKSLTDKKDIQQQLEQAIKRSEESNRSKSTFLANMSHEIRTPMTGIIGSTNLLANMNPTEDQLEFINLILHSAKSLLKIVDDVLDYSKIEAGKVALEFLSTNYKLVIDDVLHLLAAKAKEKGLKLTLEYPEDTPKYFISDPTRLRQILLNLVGNAIKFTNSGTVHIAVSTRALGGGKYQITTEVRDTGIGIDKDQLDNIFDHFIQANSSVNRKHGGTGLGTTISKQLVELMGGEISVHSEAGAGTSFIFDIPVIETKEKYLEKKRSDKIIRNYRKTIILAEDNVVNMKVAVKTLERLGLVVLPAESGEEVLTLSTQKHDLILMDIEMPGMGGLAATKKLRKSGYSRPIIAMTANVFEQDVNDFYAIGMNGFIPKPYSIEQIAKTLDQFLLRNTES